MSVNVMLQWVVVGYGQWSTGQPPSTAPTALPVRSRIGNQQVGEGRDSHQISTWVGGDEANVFDRAALAEEEAIAITSDGLQIYQQ